MDLGLTGRRALVLGGGLGGEIARTLAAEGAAVAVADLDLAAEVGRDGVTCNIVMPGRSTDDLREDSLAMIPMGRYGEPREYADMVAFLAPDRTAYVTGAQIRIDGDYIPSI